MALINNLKSNFYFTYSFYHHKNKFIPSLFGIYDSTIRFIVCKSPGQSQKGNRKKPHNRKLYINPGEYVREKVILAKQKHLKYHPGYNVALDPRDKSLYSICPGTVYYSFEKYNPDFKNHFVQEYHAYYSKAGPLYKKYVHVIPDKPKKEFKLIDIV